MAQSSLVSNENGSALRPSLVAVLPQYFVAIFALVYASGFLVTLAFHDRYGIRETATELWRARHIHIGILALVFPVILNGTVFSSWYISCHPRRDLTLSQMRQRTLPTLLLLMNLEIICYWLITLTRGGQPNSPAVGLTPMQWILAVIVFGMLLILLIERITVAFVNNFVKEDKQQITIAYPHKIQVVLRWLLVVAALALDTWFVLDFRGKLTGISLWIIAFYISVGLLFGLLAGVLSSYAKRQVDPGNKSALWAIGACLLSPLFYLMLLSYAYGVLPFIPAARGGGDYTVSPKAIIQLKPSATAANGMPFVSNNDKTRTRPLIVIEESSKGIYAADPSDAGGPEEWRVLGGRKPQLVLFSYDIISTIEFEARSAIGRGVKP